MSKIAWIGVGVMGGSMIKNLLKGGHQVSMYNRTSAKAEKVREEAGGTVCASIAETVKNAEYVFTMVGYPKDVEEIYLGADGIFAHAQKGALLIDMTTSQPTLAARLYDEGRKAGLRVMDAPVSGGDMGARNATLSIMAGGDAADFEEAMPLFLCMGRNIVLLGPAGFGQHAKAANQIAVAGATAAMTEALVYAKRVGLDPYKMLEAIGAGAAGSWQLNNMAPRVLKEDFAPGFFIKHYIKDMNIIVEEMRKRSIDLRMLDTVLSMYNDMAAQGLENDGTQALIKLYE